MERNEYLELGGLYWESNTHEWFHDKTTTHYAHKENLQGVALPDWFVFIVRSKETGEYDRVIMDKAKNNIVFSDKSLEVVGVHIDKQKLMMHFDNGKK